MGQDRTSTFKNESSTSERTRKTERTKKGHYYIETEVTKNLKANDKTDSAKLSCIR